jgi:hypothetical protein
VVFSLSPELVHVFILYDIRYEKNCSMYTHWKIKVGMPCT